MRKIKLEERAWPLRRPLRISREVIHEIRALYVEIEDKHCVGRGEAVGRPYEGETPAAMQAQLESVHHELENGVSPLKLLSLLPAGGARNAIDCALWDLQAKTDRTSVWRMIGGRQKMRAIPTAFTLGIMDTDELRRAATAVRDYRVLKIKTDSDRGLDPARIVAENAPKAQLIVDPNQSWSPAQLVAHLSATEVCNVMVIEQPLPVGEDDCLHSVARKASIAADESFTDASSIESLRGKYDILNIKLDKTGGLTEALDIIRNPKNAAFDFMIGCMAGSSLAIAPAVIIAQFCKFVDLDGPLLHSADVENPIQYQNGILHPPSQALWG